LGSSTIRAQPAFQRETEIACQESGGTVRAMKGFLSLLNLNFIPKYQDFGLLVLRIGLGLGILLLHGWKKAQLLMAWGAWTPSNEKTRLSGIENFPDPLHIGSHLSLGLAAFAEVLCACLLVVGFCSRFAALALSINMGVAFFLYHKVAFTSNGELAAAYLLGFVTILLAGPGKISIDGSGGGGGGGGAKPH
jgi:putative oxidoreductase